MEKETDTKPWWHDPMMSFFKISAWIIGPILVGVIFGDFVDKKFNTSPWIEIILTGILFIYSIYHMIKDGKKYEEEIEHELHPDTIKNQTNDIIDTNNE